jgi:hypothetical protein
MEGLHRISFLFLAQQTKHYTHTHTFLSKTGADWIPTIDLSRLATNPPKNRKELQRYVCAFIITIISWV